MQDRNKSIVLFVILIAAVIVFSFVMQTNNLPRGGNFHRSGDPLPFDLVGVQFDGAEIMQTPEGDSLPEPICTQHTQLNWESIRQQRDFVFKATDAADDTYQFPLFQSVYYQDSSGDRVPIGLGSFQQHFNHGHSILSTTILKERKQSIFFGWFRTTQEVNHVDLVVEFHHGPRRKAKMTFQGPFAPGKAITLSDGSTLTATHNHLDMDFCQFQLTTSQSLTHSGKNSILAYDKSGRRHYAQTVSGSYGTSGADLRIHFGNLVLQAIDVITIKENTQKHTFHNVYVSRNDGQVRTHAKSLDTIANRLNRTNMNPGQLASISLDSHADIIEILDVAHGRNLENCWRGLRNDSRAHEKSLTAAQKDKLQRIASKWIKSESNKEYGVLLGLWAGLPEFVGPALELIASDKPIHTDIDYFLTQRLSMLTEAHMQRMVQILDKQNYFQSTRSLLSCLRYKRDYDRAAIILKMAESNRPWLWWTGIQQLETNHEIKDETVKLSENNETLLKRIVMVHGNSYHPDLTEEQIREKCSDLHTLLTPELYRAHAHLNYEISNRLAESGSPSKATPYIVNLMQTIVDAPYCTQTDGRSDPNMQIIIRLIQVLNEWHDIRIASLEPDDHSYRTSFDWITAVNDAIHWHRSKLSPSKLPTNWQPDEHDIRIIFKSLDAPELSVISVTDFGVGDSASPLLEMRLGNDFMRFHIRKDSGDSISPYRMTITRGISLSVSKTDERAFAYQSLPQNLKLPLTNRKSWSTDIDGNRTENRFWKGDWEVWVEKVDSKQSSIEDTQVFSDWYREYIANREAGAQLSRQYNHHNIDNIKLLLEARRKQAREENSGSDKNSWTAVQIAVKTVIDEDPEFWPQSWRDSIQQPEPHETINRWKRLLERDDLTQSMQIYINWRIATLLRQIDDDRKHLAESAKHWEQAWKENQTVYSEPSINSATNWASCADDMVERLIRWGQVYRYLKSGREADFQNSAHLYRLPQKEGVPFPELDSLTANMRKHASNHISGRVRNAFRLVELSLTSALKRCARDQPDVAKQFIRDMSDIAPERQQKEWLHILEVHAKQ